MAKVMFVQGEESIKEGLFLSYKDINEPDIDNLDDLMIELGEGNLVYVEDNYQSPHRFKYTVERKKNSKGTTQVLLFSEPNHPLHNAPPLNDWLKANSLCASEIPFKNGIIYTDDAWNYNLKEI